jgi:hypothetical protein
VLDGGGVVLLGLNVGKQLGHLIGTAACVDYELLESLGLVVTCFQQAGEVALDFWIASVKQFCEFLHDFGHFLNGVQGLQVDLPVVYHLPDHRRTAWRSTVKNGLSALGAHLGSHFGHQSRVQLGLGPYRVAKGLPKLEVLASQLLESH